MGEKTEVFPTFAELCQAAREVEKKPLSLPPKPIDGKLVLDENAGIFPRGLEDYTYSYLLFEAQNVERRIYSNAVAASAPRRDKTSALTPEQQMQQNLHKFVSAQEQSSLDEEESGLVRSLEKKREKEAEARQEREGIPIPYEAEMHGEEERDAPAMHGEELPRPEETEAAPAPPAQRILPPRAKAIPGVPSSRPPTSLRSSASSMPPAAPPARPISAQAAPSVAKQPPMLPSSKPPAVPSAPEKAPAISPRMPLAPLAQEKPDAQSEAPSRPPAGISSYSKLSPRLQALIEAKLRREDEKAKKQREDEESFIKPPPPAPEPEEEEEMPAPDEAETPSRDEEGPGEQAEMPAPDAETPEREEEEDAEMPRALPLRKLAREELPGPEGRAASRQLRSPAHADDEEKPGPEEEMPAPDGEEMPGAEDEPGEEEGAPGKKEIEPEAPARADEKEFTRPAPSGPITIKPLFPDAAPAGSARPKQSSQAEDSGRMQRIQRILEDLSPDKKRASAKMEEASFASEEAPREEESPGEAEEEAPAKAPAGMKKKAAAPAPAIAPKKPAKASRKKPIAQKKTEEPEEEMPAPRKAAPLPAGPEEEPGPEDQVASRRLKSPARADGGPSAPRKLARKPVPAEAEEEEEEAPAARPARKLMPRLPQRDEADEEADAPAARLLPKKLVPRLPPREEEASEPEEEEQSPAAPLRRRILPGMVRTQPATHQTYVQPVRARKPIPAPEEEPAEEEEAPAPRKAGTLHSQAVEDAPEPEEEQPSSQKLPPIRPRKLVSDEPMDGPKTPEQVAQDEKMAKMAEQLSRLEAGKVKEVAGTAALPAEEEDIPLPEDPLPKPEAYAQAKEGLRRNLEHEETARKVRQEEEAALEQYAKEHMVWLYEIYKMGGMAREDFLQKAAEKYDEAKGEKPAAPGAGPADAPPNPALANLGKEIEKKDNK